MVQELAPIQPQQLKLYEPERRITNTEFKSPNEYFAAKYPEQFQQFGSAFLELHQPVDCFSANILPISINLDFFASVLGSAGPHHHVIYLESELVWYFKDSDSIYKTTSAEKLANLFRALIVKCAESMPANVNKLNLFHEWRSDKTAKAVVQRAKSILAADSGFFSATSSHQRVKGPELFERLMRVLCETMLERSPNACLTVTQAYQVFSKLAQARQAGILKRSMFRAEMQDLMKDVHGISLRRDIPNELGKHQEAWKGFRLVESEELAA